MCSIPCVCYWCYFKVKQDMINNYELKHKAKVNGFLLEKRFYKRPGGSGWLVGKKSALFLPYRQIRFN